MITSHDTNSTLLDMPNSKNKFVTLASIRKHRSVIKTLAWSQGITLQQLNVLPGMISYLNNCA